MKTENQNFILGNVSNGFDKHSQKKLVLDKYFNELKIFNILFGKKHETKFLDNCQLPNVYSEVNF